MSSRFLCGSLALGLFGACASAPTSAPDPRAGLPEGQAAGPGLASCNDSDCQAQAQAWLSSLASPSAAPSFVNAVCGADNDGFSTSFCECVAQDGPPLVLRGSNTPGDCALYGRAGTCLLPASAVPICELCDPAPCQAVCSDVSAALAEEASRPLAAEVRFAGCGSRSSSGSIALEAGPGNGGACAFVASIDGQCHASVPSSQGSLRRFSTPAYDCTESNEEILSAALAASSGASQAGAPATPRDPEPVEEAAPEQELPAVEPPPPNGLTPAPEACPGGPAPSVFVFDPEQRVRYIALSASHVYWYTFDAIYRQAKAGGSPERVTAVEPSGGGLIIEGDTLYWTRAPELFSLPIGGSNVVSLVSDATAPADWTARGERLYYLSEVPGGPTQVRTVPRDGGAPELLAEREQAAELVAADATGVYWFEHTLDLQPRYCGDESPAGIQKYAFDTQRVSRFATPQGSVSRLLTSGDRVLWAGHVDTRTQPLVGHVWSAPAAGGSPIQLGSAPLIRALASDGSHAYWAASASGNSYSDIYAAPLDGGEPQKIACHIYGVEQLLVDDDALYFRSWIGDVIGKLPKAE